MPNNRHSDHTHTYTNTKQGPFGPIEKERNEDVKRETQETNEGLLARFTL
jgi:hypothetical protein